MNQLTSKYTVDGTPIYEPQLQVGETVESLIDGNSGRTDDGVMRVSWIRTKIRKFSLQYNLMTSAEYEYMKNLLLGKTFTFGYWDNGEIKTVNAYCETTGGTLTQIGETSGSYTGVTFDITEL